MTKKYVVISCMILIIPILIFYQIITNYSHRLLEANIMTHNTSSADALVKRLNTEIGNTVLQLQLVSNDAKQELDLQTMHDYSREIISRSPIVHAITFLDEESRIRFEVPFMQSAEKQLYAYPLFEDSRWTLNYSVSDLSPNARGETVISVAVPVLKNNSQFKGLLIAELSREYLSEVLRIHSLSSGGFAYMIDRRGAVIAATDAGEWNKDYTDLQSVSHLLRYSFGAEKEEYRGEPSILSYELMKDGWGITVGVPERIAFEPVTRLSLLLTVGFLAILALSLLLIGLVIRNFLIPVGRLTHLAQDFTVEASLREISRLKRYHSADELGVLMRTFIQVGLSNLEKRQMLAEKEQYLRNVLESIPYAIVTLDNHGVITYCNRRFEKVTGVGGAATLGQVWAELPMHRQMLEPVTIAQGSLAPMHETEHERVHENGEREVFKVMTSRFFRETGQVEGVVVVMHDVTQQKMLEAYVKQRERLASIGQITAGVAHEIKNPLAILTGAAELLKEEVQEKGEMDELIRELVDDICQVVERMKGITNDFLHFAKQKKENWEPVRIDLLLERVLHLLRLKLKECRITVLWENEIEKPEVLGKSDQLMQVFLNLVLNSMEAMPNKGVLTIQIQKGMRTDKESVLVHIRDTGVGVSREQLDWLFNPFYSTKENGSGLGLTIARDIVSEHEGIMSIESESKGGTVVSCEFPVRSHGGGAYVVNDTYGHDCR